ncbi:MAG: endonuclease III domain-containing protein [Thermoplasmata archaeon]
MLEKNELLREIYRRLLEYYGPQHWWPGDSTFEIIVGAILTQNTSWKNVEKSIKKLKSEGLLNFDSLLNLKIDDLELMIKHSGFYRQKANRIKEFLNKVKENFSDIENMRKEENLRDFLLGIKGIGMETADSILLYAFEKPFFVVDAYTLRIFKRIGIIKNESKKNYEEIRLMVENELNKNINDLKEFHALLVELGKDHCKKRPKCDGCPIFSLCSRNI